MSEVPLPSLLTAKDSFHKVVLVTGAASGIGFATADLFAKHGAKVILVDLASCRLKAATEKIGHDCDFRACDVSSWDQQVELFEWVTTTYGPPEIICLNAGIDPELTTSETPSAMEKVSSNYLAAEYETSKDSTGGRPVLKPPPKTIFDVNFYGVLYGIKLAVHYFGERKGGRIIVTGSAASHIAFPYQDVYVSSKHALIGLVRSTSQRKELVDKNIALSMVAPWLTHTALTANLPRDVVEGAAPTSSQPEDIAKGIAYLAAAERADEVNGKCLWVWGNRGIEIEGAYGKWLGEMTAI